VGTATGKSLSALMRDNAGIPPVTFAMLVLLVAPGHGPCTRVRRVCSPSSCAAPGPASPYTDAKMKPAWSGAQLMEIPPWLWFSSNRPIAA
jgi:hypothetical protein